MKLKLYLAPGAPLGAYEIRILTNDLRTMRSQQASAVLNEGVTSILLLSIWPTCRLAPMCWFSARHATARSGRVTR